jgi:hypothetical protein
MKGIKPVSFHIPFIAFIRGCSELPNALFLFSGLTQFKILCREFHEFSLILKKFV